MMVVRVYGIRLCPLVALSTWPEAISDGLLKPTCPRSGGTRLLSTLLAPAVVGCAYFQPFLKPSFQKAENRSKS